MARSRPTTTTPSSLSRVWHVTRRPSCLHGDRSGRGKRQDLRRSARDYREIVIDGRLSICADRAGPACNVLYKGPHTSLTPRSRKADISMFIFSHPSLVVQDVLHRPIQFGIDCRPSTFQVLMYGACGACQINAVVICLALAVVHFIFCNLLVRFVNFK